MALAQAPLTGRAGIATEPIVVGPADVEIEIRGAGNCTRQVNNIMMPGFPADRLLICEVFTPSGNWSGWPPHKHDVDDPPREAVLEETYFYQFSRPEGWAIQRVYHRDGSRDLLLPVHHGDLLIVDQGYHPFIATPGYDAYFLNALAGDRRTMANSDDPDLAWVRETWPAMAPDPRLPLVRPVTPDATTALGRRRRLLRLAGPGGVIAGLAIDHRDSLRVVLEKQGLSGLTTANLRGLKAALTRALAPSATALMLDAELGQLAFESGAVPASIGLIMPLEAQGYEVAGDGRLTTLLDDFSPTIALQYGADACKLLLPYRVDDPASAARQDALVASSAAACHMLGLPLVIEPVVYRWSTESAGDYAAAYPSLLLGAVARLQPLGADLLKVPFPVLDLAATGEPAAADACRALAEACAGTPWVLLGAGVDTDTFVEQIRLAGMAGASGFLAGRGIWGSA